MISKKYKLAEDVKPQVKLLMVATAISVLIWAASWFFPFANYISYPLELFATFVHEGSHVLATLMTGGSVQSLTVWHDTSGMVWSVTTNPLSSIIVSSAGYLGTTLFGIILLTWLRYNYSARNALYFASGFVGFMTLVFGVLAPIWNILSLNVGFGEIAFTVASGLILSTALFAIGKYATMKWVNFSLAFLAIQCLLNSLFSLKTLFFISATSNSSSDAQNMANATGIPALAWVLIWIIGSVLMITIGLRLYAVSQNSKNDELPFED